MSKSVEELILDEAELKLARQRLTAQKMALQGQIAEINGKCKVRLATSDYHKLQRAKSDLVQAMTALEEDLSENKLALTESHAVLEVRHKQALNENLNRFDIQELVALRDKWHNDSMTAIYTKAAREVSWRCSQQLGAILKRFFDRNQVPQHPSLPSAH